MVLAMRLRILAILVVCICFTVASPVHRRQEDNTDAPISTTSSRTRAGQTSSTITSQPTTSKGTSDGNEDSETLTSFSATGRSPASTSQTASQTTSASKTEEIISAITSNANGAVDASSARNGNYSCKCKQVMRNIFLLTFVQVTATPNELPLDPEITPAFIVGGILLVLTGTAYTLIGVKNKWVHSFFSATYLGALCVTVLIVYVCWP